MKNDRLLGSEDANQSPFSKFEESLLRHRRLFLTVFFAGLALTLLYVFGTHKKYESDMSLIVQNERKPEVLSAEPTPGASSLVSDVTEAQLYSEVEILGSIDVLNEVVDPGWRNVPATDHTAAALSEHEKKVVKLRNHLTIEPVKKSHVIDVSYVDNDPVQANHILNRLLAAYLAHEVAVTTQTRASSFFNEEADRYQTQWRTAEQKLATFQQEHHLTSVGDKETDLNLALANVLILQRAAQAESNEVSSKVNAEAIQLATTPQRERRIERVIPSAGSIDEINTLRAQLVLRRSQLLTEYLPTDAIVGQLDKQIAEADTELANSQKMNSVEVSSDVNPKWQTLDQELADDRSRLKAVTARRAAVDSQVADLQSQLNHTEGQSVAFSTLQQAAATALANYQLYVQKHDAAVISEAMNNSGLINIGVAQSPTFSLTPVRPRPLIDTILGIITSLLLGCFAVYRAEISRRTVSNLQELGNATRYPVVATFSLSPNSQDVHSLARTSTSSSVQQ